LCLCSFHLYELFHFWMRWDEMRRAEPRRDEMRRSENERRRKIDQLIVKNEKGRWKMELHLV